MPTAIDPVAKSIEMSAAFDLHACWQVRALKEAKGQTAMVLWSVLAHTYDPEAMDAAFRLVFPWYHGPGTPMPLPCLLSAAKIDKTGAVVGDVQGQFGKKTDAVLYETEAHLRDDFRRLADRLKLNDQDRIELFKCVQRWVVADRRLDPTFDPKDPDAKRLTTH